MALKAFSGSAEASTAGIQLPVEPIQSMMFKGLQKTLYEKFELRAAWLNTSDRKTALQRLFGNPEQDQNDTSLIKYPHGFLVAGSVEDDLNRGNIHWMMSRGFPVALTTDENQVFQVRVVPTITTVTMEFVHVDFRAVTEFLTTLLHARRRSWLDFNIAYGRTTFAVSVGIDGSLQIPQRDPSPDAPPEFKVEVPLSLRGFHSLPIVVPNQVVKDISLNGSVTGGETAPATPNPNSVFWSFDTRKMTDDRQRVLNQTNSY